MTTHENHDLHRAVSELINTILNLEKGPAFEVRGQRIFPSEVHLLQLLSARPGARATDLAEGLGLTKGAVSQTLSRLEKKGLLVKGRDPANRNALDLSLTEPGRATVAHFDQKTVRMREMVRAHMETLSPTEQGSIAGFLDVLTGAIAAMGNED